MGSLFCTEKILIILITVILILVLCLPVGCTLQHWKLSMNLIFEHKQKGSDETDQR